MATFIEYYQLLLGTSDELNERIDMDLIKIGNCVQDNFHWDLIKPVSLEEVKDSLWYIPHPLCMFEQS